MRLFAADDVNDYATIRVKDTGDLYITTEDNAGGDGNIYLDADGDVTLSTDATGGVQGEITLDATLAINLDSAYTGGSQTVFKQGGSTFATITRGNSAAATAFRLYEGANLGSTDDYFQITSLEHGATTISTVDDNDAAAHLTIEPDGDMIFKSDGLVLQDNGDVSTPADGYGTLYVNSDVLYFKTDGGTATNLLSGGAPTGDSGNAAIYDNSGDPALKAGITANEVIDLLGVLKNGDVGGADTFTGTLTIDRNKAPAGTTANYNGLLVDYDRTNTPSSGNDFNTGIRIEMDCEGATSSGSQFAAGLESRVTFSAHAGTRVAGHGAFLACTGADAGHNKGLGIQTEGVGPDIIIYSSDNANDYFTISTIEDGETTLATVEDGGGSTAHMNFVPDGDFKVDSTGDVILDSGGSDIFFKLNGGTFAQMSSQEFYIYNLLDTPDDYFKIAMSNDGVTTLSTNDDNGANGHLNIEPDGHVEFDGCGVGFDLVTPTYNAADTNVDFRTGNKQMVTLTGNIADLNLTFPATSGNFTILLKQDGTGSRLMEADGWLAFESDGTAATVPAVKFPGGTAPTLTTAANHVDIISFFWDADNQVCYGVASLDFQD